MLLTMYLVFAGPSSADNSVLEQKATLEWLLSTMEARVVFLQKEAYRRAGVCSEVLRLIRINTRSLEQLRARLPAVQKQFYEQPYETTTSEGRVEQATERSLVTRLIPEFVNREETLLAQAEAAGIAYELSLAEQHRSRESYDAIGEIYLGPGAQEWLDPPPYTLDVLYGHLPDDVRLLDCRQILHQ